MPTDGLRYRAASWLHCCPAILLPPALLSCLAAWLLLQAEGDDADRTDEEVEQQAEGEEDEQGDEDENGDDDADGDEEGDDDDDDDDEEEQSPWLFGVADQLSPDELRPFIQFGDDVRLISLDSTCWPSAFAALIALRSQGLVNFETPNGGQPPQAECVQCMLTAFRALCAKSTVIVIKTDPRRRATIAVVGLLVRCIEAAYDDVLNASSTAEKKKASADAAAAEVDDEKEEEEEELPQTVVVLTGWGLDTISAPAVVDGGAVGDMEVLQVDTSGEAAEEEEEEEEAEEEEEEEEVEGNDDDEDEEEEEAEDGDQDEEEEEGAEWLYGTRSGVSTAELREVMEAEDGVYLLELDLAAAAGRVADGSGDGSGTAALLERLAQLLCVSLRAAAAAAGSGSDRLGTQHAAALQRCCSSSSGPGAAAAVSSVSAAVTALLEEHSLILVVRGEPSDAPTTRAALALLELLETAQRSEDASQLVVVMIGWIGTHSHLEGPSVAPPRPDEKKTATFDTTELEI